VITHSVDQQLRDDIARLTYERDQDAARAKTTREGATEARRRRDWTRAMVLAGTARECRDRRDRWKAEITKLQVQLASRTAWRKVAAQEGLRAKGGAGGAN